MKVLFCTLPHHTHFLTAAPLLWALRTAGHEVRVAGLPGFADTITQAGLTAVPLGVDPPVTDTAEDRAAIRKGLPAPYDLAERLPDEVTWTAEMADSYDIMVRYAFREENAPLVDDLVTFARAWQPDLVLWEPFSYAGAIAAKACGAVHGRLLFTADVLGITHEWIHRNVADDPLVDWLTASGKQYGFDYSPDLVFGQCTVDQLPPSLRPAATGLDYVSSRYVPYGGPAVVPKWLWAAPQRPRVALTMGLSAIEFFDGYTFRPLEVLDALADLDVEVVATVADGAEIGAVPGNCRVVPYVPLHALAPTCSAVIHHGGFGTLSTVALYGVPQLVLPYHFEGPLLADRLAAHGAGIALHSDLVTGATVRENLSRLLTEPAYRRRAGDLRDELLTLPAPNEAAARLAELTARHAGA